MSMYRKEWSCCGSVTETDAWEPESCPFCTATTIPRSPSTASEVSDPRAAFEAWSKHEGALHLMEARFGECEDGRLNSTYHYSPTETAFRSYCAALASKPVAREVDERQEDQLVGAMYALRHIAAGNPDPAKCAQSALDVIAKLDAKPAEPAGQHSVPDVTADEIDSLFHPPKAMLKREDWNPATRKPYPSADMQPSTAGAAKGGNTQPSSGEVDVEAERKLTERIQTALDLLADAKLPSTTWRDVSNVLHACRDSIARRTQEGAKDAERFRQAIACEDSAEVLYGAVLSHAPNGKAIRNEFDAAIAATQTKESQE